MSKCDVDFKVTKYADLASCGSASAAAGAQTVRFRLVVPSVQLHVTLIAGVVPGAAGAGASAAPHSYTSETWQLFPQFKGGDLQAAFSDARQLPDSYEFETGISEIRGELYLQNLQGEGSREPGIYRVEATFEPVIAMCAEDRARLFALCGLAAERPTLLDMGGGPA
jgi:hypothetical protein